MDFYLLEDKSTLSGNRVASALFTKQILLYRVKNKPGDLFDIIYNHWS